MKKITLLTLLGLLSFVLNTNAQNIFTQIQQSNSYQEVIDMDMSSRTVISTVDTEIQGSLCVGVDCIDSENYGFDTFRLKENNLRIHFEDTSTSASFPANDWRITINDSGNGGDSYFGIDDATGNVRPFRINAGAPNNAFKIDAQGDVGIGLSGNADAVVELHVADGDTPALRLEQNGTSGFTPQSWDVAGNETNFFVRDVTNSSALPFKIIPGASDNAFVIRGNAIGVGGAGNGVNTNASIDLKSSTEGLLLNRMTNAQRTTFEASLTATEKGILVYDTDDNQLYSWDGTQWQSGGTDTDDQGVDVFQLNGSNELELSLDNDGVATQTVDLSSFLDNTDDQGADVFQLNGSNELELSLEDDGVATQTVDLSSFLDNTDDQGADVFQLNGSNELELSLEDDGVATQTVDLSSFLDNTDDQQLSLNTNSLELEDGGSVDLTGYLDNTDDQNISGSGLSGTTLTIGIEGGASETVDLSSLDNSGTDDQTIDAFLLNGNDLTLSLENDNTPASTVDLSGYLDNTDNQNISGSGLSGNTLTIGIEGGASETVDLSPLNNSGSDDQQLSLLGNSLNLEDGGSVDLTAYLDNTDNQTLANFILGSNILGISIAGGNTVQVNLTPLIDPLEADLAAAEAQIQDLQNQLVSVLERLDAIEDCACDGTLGVADYTVQPEKAFLYQNLPNPFDNTTLIKYFVPLTYSNANIVISATSGRILDNQSNLRLGDGSITVNKNRMQAGVYFYTLFVDGKRVDTKRMIVE